MKKAKELGKKNEVKEYKKKTENKILKTYVKKVSDKIVEKKKKEVKPEIKPKQTNITVTAPPTNNNKFTDEQIIVNEWTTPLNYIILQQYDMKTYENIENTIIKENKLNHHIFTPNELVLTKKYKEEQ